MPAFNPGDYVLIHARVVNVYGADREEAYQTYGLQLSDGQGLQTNVQNLEPVPPAPQPEEAPKKAKALTQPAPRSHKMVTGPDVSPKK